jgi:hypothetical protein
MGLDGPFIRNATPWRHKQKIAYLSRPLWSQTIPYLQRFIDEFAGSKPREKPSLLDCKVWEKWFSMIMRLIEKAVKVVLVKVKSAVCSAESRTKFHWIKQQIIITINEFGRSSSSI